MIVKNEAPRLRVCLESVQGWVDEMVIVDTGSEDDTIAIAKSFEAKVYTFDWCDDFAAARNFSLQWVDSDWVLVLDADEVMLPEALPLLNQAMEDDNTLLINLLREEVGAKQGPLSLISRLFRNHPQLQFRRPYHELIDDSVAELQSQEPHWKIESLAIPAIRHDGYDPARLKEKDKLQRAKTLLEKGIEQYPHDAYLHSKLGGLYWDFKDYKAAESTLKKGLELVSDEPAVSYELWYHLALVQKAQGQIKDAEAAYQKAIAQQYPDLLKVGAYLNLGSLYLEHGVFPAAQKLLEHCVQLSPQMAIAHYNLGLTYKSQNQFEAAIASYQKAIAIESDYAMAHQNLGVVYFKLGKMKESRTSFETAIALYEKTDINQAQQLRAGIQDLGF